MAVNDHTTILTNSTPCKTRFGAGHQVHWATTRATRATTVPVAWGLVVAVGRMAGRRNCRGEREQEIRLGMVWH